MLVNVTYDNPHYEEHNEYTVTLVEAVDCLNGIVKSEWVVGQLEKSGEAVIKNGYATTTIRDTKEFYCYEPNCGLRFAADDEESFLKHNCLRVCRTCGTESPTTMVRQGDHVGRLSPEEKDEQIPLCEDCRTGKSFIKDTEWNPGDQNNPAVMCEFCQRIDTPIGGDFIMTVSANECRWADRENHDNEDYAVWWEVYSALGDECVCGGAILECRDDYCCWGQDGLVCHRPMMERLLKVLQQ